MSQIANTEWRVKAEQAGTRLDKWLAAPERLGSRAKAADAIARGRVFVNGTEQPPGASAAKVNAGDRVGLWMDRPGSATLRPARRTDGLDIVFEDDLLVVINKPAGLLTVPLDDDAGEPSLVHAITRYWRSHGKRAPLVAHRIDRDTTGLVVFAKDPRAWRMLREQFVRREPERVYQALVEGVPDPPEATWRDWLRWNPARLQQELVSARSPRSLEAITQYSVKEAFGAAALIEVSLVSGRRHQIRVQAWLHGHPLVGERKYRRDDQPHVVEFPRQALHAARLAFEHPRSGRLVRFEARMPGDMRRLLAKLRSGAEPRERVASRE